MSTTRESQKGYVCWEIPHCSSNATMSARKFWALHYSVYQKGDGEEAVLAGKTDKIGDSVKLLIESYVNSGQKAAQRDHQSTPLLKAG